MGRAFRVALVNPPWEKPGAFFVRAGSRWPHFELATSRYMPFPFFMGYAAAVLEQRGFAPTVIDGCAEHLTLDAFYARLAAASPDLVLLETSTPSFSHDREVAAEIRRRFPSSRLAAAGPWEHPDGLSLLELAEPVDFFLLGEYEETLADLTEALADGRPFSDLRSLEFRSGGSITRNPRGSLRQDLDSLPVPARHLFPMTAYQDLAGVLPAPSLQLWASRGCPFGCQFCLWPQLMYKSRTYRVRAPAAIVDEIVRETARLPYRSLYFDDDTFNIGKERMLALCAEMKRRGVSLPWGMMARADTSDEETLLAMRGAGLTAAKFGLESCDQGLVDAADKGLDLATAFRGIRFARSLDIRVHLTFTFGLPGETRDTIRRTVDQALALDPDSVQFSILTPFPGSALFARLRAENQLTSLDFSQYDGYSQAVFRSEHLTASQLEKACAWAERRWNRHRMRQWLFRRPWQALEKVWADPAWAFGKLRRILADES